MLSGVLRSQRAIHQNIEIMRAFVRLRELASRHADLEERLDELEARCEGRFQTVFTAIRKLLSRPARRKNPIGFKLLPDSRSV
jgi:DnaJ-domain-containing protein 1